MNDKTICITGAAGNKEQCMKTRISIIETLVMPLSCGVAFAAEEAVFVEKEGQAR